MLVKNRVGGRIDTFSSGNWVADLGAMVITGLGISKWNLHFDHFLLEEID